MRRIAYQPASASSGGGGAPTVGSLEVGPEYGERDKPALAAHVAMPDFGFTANRTVGSSIRLSATEFAANRSVGVHLDTNANFTNNRSVAAHVAQPEVAFSGGRAAGAQVLMPATAFEAARAASVHLGATYLGAPNWQSVGVVESSTSASSIVIPKPSGLAVGDFMLAIIGSDGLQTFTAPSGWTNILNTQRDGTLDCSLDSKWKIADASDVAASSFTFTSSGTQGFFGAIHRVDAIDTTTPVNVSGQQTGSATDPVAPSVTTTAANCLVFVCCIQRNALDVTFTPPASYTERTDQNGNGLAGAHVVDGETATRVRATTGATGAQTMDSSALVAADYASQTIAIAPGTQVLQS